MTEEASARAAQDPAPSDTDKLTLSPPLDILDGMASHCPPSAARRSSERICGLTPSQAERPANSSPPDPRPQMSFVCQSARSLHRGNSPAAPWSTVPATNPVVNALEVVRVDHSSNANASPRRAPHAGIQLFEKRRRG